MKTTLFLSASSLALLLFSGCVTVKTEHKIEPINITVDINVKVDNALEDFFGDIDTQSEYRTETEM